MGIVLLNMAISLDGFVAGPNANAEEPMGIGGRRLHAWMFGAPAAADAAVLEDLVDTSGAVVIGRRTYDVGIAEWGGESPFRVPCVVVSHRAAPPAPTAGAPFAFVSGGVEDAVGRAKAAAGDGNVWVMGGASVGRQALRAGLVDEIQLHVVPVLLGQGVRLFDGVGDGPIELERTRVVEAPAVTHLRFRVGGRLPGRTGRSPRQP
jgi:dihydrofolate reductase